MAADHSNSEIPSRRPFFGQLAGLVAGAAWSQLSGAEQAAAALQPHTSPRARRIIYLFQSGAPSQLDLFDHKPRLCDWQNTDLPESIRQGQRLTGMTATQDRFPIAASRFRFAQHGESGTWLSELLPATARIADELCIIRSLHTEAINHDPAVTFLQTGAQLAGRPSIGAWLNYGLGSVNQNLPAFVVMISGTGDQPLYDRLWGSGFLPSRYQGIKLRSVGDPVPFLAHPAGLSPALRRQMLDDLAVQNRRHLVAVGDPEIATRMEQYELAFRMQSSVPDLVDLSTETQETFRLYGDDSRTPGTFAYHCLLARRLAERGVGFIQVFHRGWDQHRFLPRDIEKQCQLTDQASAALVLDLKRRGLLEDTLVVWGGEFGRTVYCQGPLSVDDYGRDHHPRCFTVWLAGGGVKAGLTYGQTDDYGYNVVDQPVDVHDFHATLLQLLGLHHERLSYRFQGRDYRLTDVAGRVIPELLA
ncbi:MAG: DUF1501 domain-containing protein [Planctomycetaceae bacterium]|nr:DUF1501 domain-containing protein [Planctomycetaceae bacterium]